MVDNDIIQMQMDHIVSTTRGAINADSVIVIAAKTFEKNNYVWMGSEVSEEKDFSHLVISAIDAAIAVLKEEETPHAAIPMVIMSMVFIQCQKQLNLPDKIQKRLKEVTDSILKDIINRDNT